VTTSIGKSRAFEIMSPSFLKLSKIGEELFVVDIIVEFWSGKGLGVEHNRV